MSAVIAYDHPQARSVETELELMAPRFGNVLAGSSLDPQRLIQSILIAMDRNRDLFKCDRQSILMAAMSAAVIGLECDGTLGQSFLVPFNVKGRGLVAQQMTGYRGYGTLAARGGFVIRSGVVREGEVFEYDRPSGHILHREILGNERDIVAAWAKTAHATMPPLIEVVPIEVLLELRAHAKGPTWKTNFAAMCEKTPRRRLGRSLPLGSLPQFAIAARIDEAADEQGLHSWADEGGVHVGGSVAPSAPSSQQSQPIIDVADSDEFSQLPPVLATKARAIKQSIATIDNVHDLDAQWSKIPKTMQQIKIIDPAIHDALVDLYDKRSIVLNESEEGESR